MSVDELFMRRCFDLAALGRGSVSPNPMVGAVLVHENRIIGEGYHRVYGQAHAEVQALAGVSTSGEDLLPHTTLYVSLEPCCFYGKTPPCTNLIIERGIPRVVISCLDDTPEVAGKGVAQLRAAGVEVITGVLEKEGRRLSRARSVFVTEHRPYVILKFARSYDGKIGLADRQAWITNAFSGRLVHKWRAEADAILVGTHTALIDDPQLTNRLYFGKSPLRIVLDRRLVLPASLRLFDGEHPTLVVTEREPLPDPVPAGPEYLSLPFDAGLLANLLRELARRRIGVLLVEGGARLLESFLHAGLWDEARVLTGRGVIPGGLPAPTLPAPPVARYALGGDELAVYFSPAIENL